MAQNHSLPQLRLIPDAEIYGKEQEEAKKAEEEQQGFLQTKDLATYIRNCWQRSRDAKEQKVNAILLDCKRRRESQYPSDKAALYQQVGSDVFMSLTDLKCSAAESWINDTVNQNGARSWSINPTPIPDLSPQTEQEIHQRVTQKVMEVIDQFSMQATSQGQMIDPSMIQQFIMSKTDAIKAKITKAQNDEAKKRCEKMSQKIEDQFVEGSFYLAFRDFVSDVTTYPAAFLKGPVFENRRGIEWIQDEVGSWTQELTDRVKPVYKRVSPFDIFPEPDSKHVNDGFLIEKIPLNRKELHSLIGVEGYNEEAIRSVLKEHSQGGLKEDWTSVDSQRSMLEMKNNTAVMESDKITGLEFWGSVPGSMLVEWGMDEMSVDMEKDYEVSAILIGYEVIKAVLNPDKLGHKPYYCTSFVTSPDSIWGKSLPEKIKSCQDACNTAARAIVNNMSIASGPQVIQNIDMQSPGTSSTIFPWKVWKVTTKQRLEGKPVEFFTVPLISDKLLNIYKHFSQEADELSMIPAYAHGSDQAQGAGKTASGLSMLMSNSAKGMRDLCGSIYMDVINPLVQAMYVYNMLYDEDQSIKGDSQVVPQGIYSLIAKEQLAIRRNEFLQTTNNPVDLEIIGQKGRRILLREVMKPLEVDIDQILPPEEEITTEDLMSFSAGPANIAPQPGVPMPGQAPQPGAVQNMNLAGQPAGGQEASLFGGVANG